MKKNNDSELFTQKVNIDFNYNEIQNRVDVKKYVCEKKKKKSFFSFAPALVAGMTAMFVLIASGMYIFSPAAKKSAIPTSPREKDVISESANVSDINPACPGKSEDINVPSVSLDEFTGKDSTGNYNYDHPISNPDLQSEEKDNSPDENKQSEHNSSVNIPLIIAFVLFAASILTLAVVIIFICKKSRF